MPVHLHPLPLIRRFPALGEIPRASLGHFPSPIEQLPEGEVGGALWIKRDDLNAESFGGNKVRALEFLLGAVQQGDRVLTAGGEGSTHVLVTAAMARRLGARTSAVRWAQEMNPTARLVAARASELCERIVTVHSPIVALVRAALMGARSRVYWIPVGGTSPLGMLGHVNAALELADQVAAGVLPLPERIVVPLGSGGTAAGLAAGCAIAGLETTIVAARVTPRVVVNRARVLRLARAALRLIHHHTGERLPSVQRGRVHVVHDVYGGAYGRPLPAARTGAALLERLSGVRLDESYSAKAFAAALALARRDQRRTLFWLTFDARWMRG
ncbi:MAG TPA: pyridoxal-phosphate dependent enzyme [Gemmatimonadaceae bacterium]|nr:pyridoxal-phosphate dependent enzyme [Gemmatimonadaceae bacterium]